MKRIYRAIIVIALLGITAGVIAFGVTGSSRKQSEEEEQRYAWPLATCSTEETITHVFASTFAEEVGKLSDGKMKIQVYPQSTLGGDRELLESC